MSKIRVDAIGLGLMVLVALLAHAMGVPVVPCLIAVLAALGLLVWDVRKARLADSTDESADADRDA